MKNRVFMWGWTNHAPIVDHTMTADRMVLLMRAWRRARIGGRRVFEFVQTSRIPLHSSYRITHLPSGESATFTITSAPTIHPTVFPKHASHAL